MDRQDFAHPGRRFAGYCVDLALFIGFFQLIALVTGVDLDRPPPLWFWTAGPAAMLVYFTVSNRLSASVGQRVVGVRVKRRDGDRLSWAQAALRGLGTLLGPYTALTARRPDYRTIGDRLGGTVVVRR